MTAEIAVGLFRITFWVYLLSTLCYLWHFASPKSAKGRTATESLASGVDPAKVKAAINERATNMERLKALSKVELPRKISAKNLESQARDIRKTAESRDPDGSGLLCGGTSRLCRPTQKGAPFELHPLSTICGHSLVEETCPPQKLSLFFSSPKDCKARLIIH